AITPLRSHEPPPTDPATPSLHDALPIYAGGNHATNNGGHNLIRVLIPHTACQFRNDVLRHEGEHGQVHNRDDEIWTQNPQVFEHDAGANESPHHEDDHNYSNRDWMNRVSHAGGFQAYVREDSTKREDQQGTDGVRDAQDIF